MERGIGIFGAGGLGRRLALELAAAGTPVLLGSRNVEAARGLCAAHPGLTYADPARLAAGATLLLCVSDRALAEVARAFAQHGRDAGEGVVLHTSGFEGLDVLAPLAAQGWQVGRFHPLITAPPPGPPGARDAGDDSGPRPAPWITLAGAPAAVERGRSLVRALGARELVLRGDDAGTRARYHAAATLAAGGVTALFDALLALARDTVPEGSEDDLCSALVGLAQGALHELAQRGPAAALTGPQARGDAHVVAAHLAAVHELDPGLAPLYTALSRRMLDLACARGSLGAHEEQLVRRTLEN